MKQVFVFLSKEIVTCSLWIGHLQCILYNVHCTLEFLHCYCIQDIEHCKLSIGNCPFYIVGILYLVPHTMYIVSMDIYNVQCTNTMYNIHRFVLNLKQLYSRHRRDISGDLQ